ncbi:MAG: response regulator [Anaerolineales bacterium]|nr:response regulator [Anaerolineales bacterium]
MQLQRVLVVDDDPETVAALAENLECLGDQYIIESASSGVRALVKVQHHRYALVITDLYMPEVDGWELIKRIRITSPQTQLILITGYLSPDIEAKAREFDIFRCLAKPFMGRALLSAASEALQELEAPSRKIVSYSVNCLDAIETALIELAHNTGARCVMLADAKGSLIACEGDSGGIDMATLLALVAGGFATAAEISRCLGDQQAMNLNFHEGSSWEIYSASLSDKICLILLFDKKAQSGRIGMVWLYAKRTIQTLIDFIKEDTSYQVQDHVSEDFKTSLSSEIDLLFIEGEKADGEVEAKSSLRSEKIAEKQALKTPLETMLTKLENHKTIPLIEAQALGIIPTDLLADNLQTDINEEDAEDEQRK